MNDFFRLLGPRFIGIKNDLYKPSSGIHKKFYVIVIVGISFWLLLFFLFRRVLTYFQSVEVIGNLLSHHLLAVILLTFFSLLIFSHIITALSNLYLSEDLDLCHSSPVSLEALFVSRTIYTMVDSSWMVVLFGLPVMMAYAFVFNPGIGFYFSVFHLGIAMIIIAAGIGILLTMIMVNIFPAQRTRDIVGILMIVGIIALFLMFRLLRPERLVDPDAFFSVMQYVTALKSPDSQYVPTHWATEILWTYLSGSSGGSQIFNILLMWSTSLAIIVINLWVAESIYFNGFSKSQEANSRSSRRGMLDYLIRIIKRPFKEEFGSIIGKDVRVFFRDNTQWSQLLLLGALVAVYLYNFSALPLEKSPIKLDFLQNELAFLNMGLASFVLSAVCVRFVFPSISGEGQAFWIVKSSPISIRQLLWSKFSLYIVPMLILGEVLIVITNIILEVSMFMMLLSTVTMFFLIFDIVAMGVGFGALYPRFKYENIAQVSTGFGGLMYMIFCAVLIGVVIILEAGPVYLFFMTDISGQSITGGQWFLIVCPFIIVLVINYLAFIKPMRIGERALGSLD